jgi:hypothetical protein
MIRVTYALIDIVLNEVIEVYTFDTVLAAGPANQAIAHFKQGWGNLVDGELSKDWRVFVMLNSQSIDEPQTRN